MDRKITVFHNPVSVYRLGDNDFFIRKYQVTQRKSEKKEVTGPIHYVNIIDRSGSMINNIDQLIDQVQVLYRQIRHQDLWSLIWFNSPRSYKTLLRGSVYDERFEKQLDSLRSVFGTTCFSESIQNCQEIVNDFSSVVSGTVVTLFTDGCPVVSNIEHEMDRSISLVKEMSRSLIAFHTIGFGNYYNRDFLRKMSEKTEFGQFVHISNIDDFTPVYRKNTEEILDLQKCSILVDMVGSEIVCLSGKTVLYGNEVLDLDHLDLENNGIYVLTPTKNKVRGTLSMEGVQLHHVSSLEEELVKNSDLCEIVQENHNVIPHDLEYAYALCLYRQKRTKEALQVIVRNTGDREIADQILSSFTYDEMSKTEKCLEGAVFDRSHRHMFSCDESYVPNKDALCVIDVLAMLNEGENLYSPFAWKNTSMTSEIEALRKELVPYRRITEKTVDVHDTFEWTKEEVLASLSDLVYSQDRANISVRFPVSGHVYLNPKTSLRVGLPEKFPAKRYQVHTFIKDGNLNIPVIECLLDETTFVQFESVKVPMSVIDKKEDKSRVIIDLRKLPLINGSYVEKFSENFQNIVDLVHEMTSEEAMQKIIHYHMKELGLTEGMMRADETDLFALYNEEQIQVLLDHGITSKGVYAGISRKTEEKSQEDRDFYWTRELSFYVKGVSSLPSVESVLQKNVHGKKLTLREEYIDNANEFILDELSRYPSMSREEVLLDILDDAKYNISVVRDRLSKLKIAMILNADFSLFSQLKFDEKGVAEKDGVVVKFNKVKQYI